jgi:hypothetical protein
MKIVVLALVAALAATGHTLARERAASGANLHAVSLLPPVRCDQTSDERQCQVAGPKAWTADERRVIEDAMARLTGSELFRGVLVGARDNGYTGLRRYLTATMRDPTHGRIAMFSPGFVLYGSKDIGITDAFFQTESVRDPISEYRYGDLILVHELVHAFDDRRGSTEPGFTSVSGWVFKNERWAYVNPVDLPAYRGVFADTLTLYARGRYGDAWTRDRSFATTMTFPLPTIQSLVSPGESFADILAHLIVDARATSYLKPQIVDWFETHVFPALRTNAARFDAAADPF